MVKSYFIWELGPHAIPKESAHTSTGPIKIRKILTKQDRAEQCMACVADRVNENPTNINAGTNWLIILCKRPDQVPPEVFINL